MPVSKKEVGQCPVDAMMRVMDGRWKCTILWRLLDAPQRYQRTQAFHSRHHGEFGENPRVPPAFIEGHPCLVRAPVHFPVGCAWSVASLARAKSTILTSSHVRPPSLDHDSS
jgi:hypothetical protein